MAFPLVPVIGGALGALGGLAGSMGQSPTQQTSSNSSQAGTNQGWTQSTPHPNLAPMLGQIGGIGTQMGSTSVPFFPGATYVGPSGATQAGVNIGMGSMPYYQQGAESMAGATGNQQAAADTALENYNFLSGAADVASNPYVQAQLKANESAINRNLNENLLPRLQQGAVSVNALGSSRLGLAQGRAVGDTSQALANQNANTMLQAYGQGLGAQQGALSSLGGLQSGMVQPGVTQGMAGNMMNQAGQAGLGYGQVVEGYQGKALQDAMQRFSYQYQEPWQRAQSLAGLAGVFNPYSTNQSYNNSFSRGSGTNTTPNPAYTSPLQGAIGGAMGGVGLANSLFKPTPSPTIANGAMGMIAQNPAGFGTIPNFLPR